MAKTIRTSDDKNTDTFWHTKRFLQRDMVVDISIMDHTQYVTGKYCRIR